jgi:hypothetical protein
MEEEGRRRVALEFCEEAVRVVHNAVARGREGGGGSECYKLKMGRVDRLGPCGLRRCWAKAGPG